MMQKKPGSPYDHIRVYRQGRELADLAWKTVQRWNSREQVEIGDELARSADMLATYIERSFSGTLRREKVEFSRRARAAFFETRHWLKKAYRADLINDDEADAFLVIMERMQPDLDKLVTILTSR